MSEYEAAREWEEENTAVAELADELNYSHEFNDEPKRDAEFVAEFNEWFDKQFGG